MSYHALWLAMLIGSALVRPGSVSSVARPGHAAEHILDAGAVAQLLTRPPCLASFSDSVRFYVLEERAIPSKGITLSGQLYLPRATGRSPAVILVPGGFNEIPLIMASPRYYAPRWAHCGIAAFVYYKRGCGASGGVYADATEDDFIDDVGNIVRALMQDPRLDPNKIGVMGGSGGGRIAALAAARFANIHFVISNSGPIVSYEEAGNYNIEGALRVRGHDEATIQKLMPLWRRHHAAWARADTAMLQEVATEIAAARREYDFSALPTPYQEVFADTNLTFLWPSFRSAARDYLSELAHLHVPWLCIYGEKDTVVPVASSVHNIETLMQRSGNDDYSIIVLPGVDHSLVDPATRRQVPVVRIAINWVLGAVLGE
jgi:pimeloyl-ACP methyl ester carboxylesterase